MLLILNWGLTPSCIFIKHSRASSDQIFSDNHIHFTTAVLYTKSFSSGTLITTTKALFYNSPILGLCSGGATSLGGLFSLYSWRSEVFLLLPLPLAGTLRARIGPRLFLPPTPERLPSLVEYALFREWLLTKTTEDITIWSQWIWPFPHSVWMITWGKQRLKPVFGPQK